MGKSITAIHKEIEKKEYDKTALGKAEKEMRKFYDAFALGRIKMDDELQKTISDIREENSKAMEESSKDYNSRIDTIRKEHDALVKEARETIDGMLLNAMNKELLILNNKFNATS